jgi:hypothetical protein
MGAVVTTGAGGTPTIATGVAGEAAQLKHGNRSTSMATNPRIIDAISALLMFM